MTLYNQGRHFEYRVRDLFEESDYFVVRSAGSHGQADLVAIPKDGTRPLLVQCKHTKRGISAAEWNGLWRVAESVSCIGVVAEQEGRLIKLWLVDNAIKPRRNKRKAFALPIQALED